jgi:abortive infection bacteriophage resistance protein
MRNRRVTYFTEADMLYSEKALTIDEQVDLLISKGLAADKDVLKKSLTNVSYHRLGGYWHPYKLYNEDESDWCFREGTDFAVIWDRYVFDRQLRLLVFDAIERVEVAIRNDLILNVAVEQGPFGYLNPTTLPNIGTLGNRGSVLYSHDILLGSIRGVVRRELKAENPAVVAFADDYPGNADYLPYWLLLEVLDFGTLAHIVHGLPTKTKSKIARRYGIKRYSVLDSWADMLRITRNRCGHHLST